MPWNVGAREARDAQAALDYLRTALPAPGGNTYNDYLAVVSACKQLGLTEAETAAWAEGTARRRVEYTWSGLGQGSREPVGVLVGIAKRYGYERPVAARLGSQLCGGGCGRRVLDKYLVGGRCDRCRAPRVVMKHCRVCGYEVAADDLAGQEAHRATHVKPEVDYAVPAAEAGEKEFAIGPETDGGVGGCDAGAQGVNAQDRARQDVGAQVPDAVAEPEAVPDYGLAACEVCGKIFKVGPVTLAILTGDDPDAEVMCRACTQAFAEIDLYLPKLLGGNPLPEFVREVEPEPVPTVPCATFGCRRRVSVAWTRTEGPRCNDCEPRNWLKGGRGKSLKSAPGAVDSRMPAMIL